MIKDPGIAGIVLAGGRSSRMGQNKALLDYHGKPLVEHMMQILSASGINEVYISGHIQGYKSVQDTHPFSGPAIAIKDFIKQKPDYEGYLFVPVDMPRLTPDILSILLSHKKGAYFTGYPLPVFVTEPIIICDNASVQKFMDAQGIPGINLCPEKKFSMVNANTPKEWTEALSES